MNETWTTFLQTILKMPGAKVHRESFLRNAFKTLPADKLSVCLKESPLNVVTISEIDKVASSVIGAHTNKATFLSALSGIPGGFAMLATIPADLANYYYHVVAVGQKLGYLYGYPDMVDANGNLTEDGKIMLTAFIGVMNKVTAANEVIKKIAVEVSKRMTEGTAARIAGNILSKQIVAQSVEVIARKLGTQVTAKTASRGITKVIPVVSGVICGGLTYATFKPQAKRLHQALKNSASN